MPNLYEVYYRYGSENYGTASYHWEVVSAPDEQTVRFVLEQELYNHIDHLTLLAADVSERTTYLMLRVKFVRHEYLDLDLENDLYTIGTRHKLSKEVYGELLGIATKQANKPTTSKRILKLGEQG